MQQDHWVRLVPMAQKDKHIYKSIVIRRKPKKDCPFCKSKNIVKAGWHHNKLSKKQRYLCRNCGKKFILDNGFMRMKNRSKIIGLAIDLYFQNLSLRKTKDHLKRFYRTNISHVAIWNWLIKYVKLIKPFVNKFTPKISGKLNADEICLKFRGKCHWFWDVMDKETKFLIASVLSSGRGLKEARKLFLLTRKSIKKNPDVIVTDGLQEYIQAIKKSFPGWWTKKNRVKHIRVVKFKSKDNNNVIERLQGTARERYKIMRGFSAFDSAETLMDGFTIFYNFIRPHMTLNGLTPAQASGIDLKLAKNRWLSIIKLVAYSK